MASLSCFDLLARFPASLYKLPELYFGFYWNVAKELPSDGDRKAFLRRMVDAHKPTAIQWAEVFKLIKSANNPDDMRAFDAAWDKLFEQIWSIYKKALDEVSRAAPKTPSVVGVGNE